MTSFLVIGSSSDDDTFFCEHLVKRIAKVDKSVTVQFELMLEVDYQLRLKDLTVRIGGDLYTHTATHLVLRDGTTYIGAAMDLIKLANKRYGIEDAEIANTIVFGKAKVEETRRLLRELGHKCAYIEFNEDPTGTVRSPALFGKIIIELYDDICPEACANFLKLCTGAGITLSGTPLFYRNCPIHRLVSGGWLQTGDIVDGTGQYSMSAGGEEVLIRDESFAVDFGLPEGGIVGYSASGPHANGSQFFITFGPCEWMQNSFVGFGRVVVGNSVLRKLEREPTSNQKPNKNIIITACGEEK